VLILDLEGEMMCSSCRTARRALRLAVVAAGAASLAAPASAGLVTASTQVLMPDFVEVYRADNGVLLDLRTSVAVERGGFDRISVTRTTPGVSTDSAMGSAAITNLLGTEIRVNFYITDFHAFANVELVPGERGSASASYRVLGNGGFVDAWTSAAKAECRPPEFRCNADELETGAVGPSRNIAPFDTLRFDIRGSVRAELGIIPLPASAPLLLLGIGALGWLGRRRAQPGRRI
jgi:hypothetical protein